MGYARLQEEPFALDSVLAELRHDRTGGVAFYVGTVRSDDAGGRVDALHYESFPEMAQKALEGLRRDCVTRFELTDAIVIHRTGRITAGEPILVVAVAAPHRAEAFAALAFFMDRLKEIVPLWKQEEGPGGKTWILGAESKRVKA